MERELSQLAARGMAKDGWMILMPVGLAMRCGLGQSALRGRILFWTAGGRAPAPGHLGAGSFPVGPLGRQKNMVAVRKDLSSLTGLGWFGSGDGLGIVALEIMLILKQTTWLL
jgi:hypothetical protein